MKNFIRESERCKNNSKKLGINIFKILNKFVLLYLILIKCINSNTIVQLIINGVGKQKILSSEFEKPEEIYINGEIQNYTEYYDLAKTENNISMKWNNQLININNMFSNLSNIIKADFSNVILSTNNIGAICAISSLISLNLNNFSIKSRYNNIMEHMFSGCSSLISLNLNNFSITSDEFNNMKNMFSGCSSLISLNLNNFSIISHDFNNRMQYMFSNCSSLISLNLNNFSIASNINYMQYMFSNCSSLISLNLNYFNISGNSNMTGIVKGCDPNLIYCTEDPNLIEQIRELNSSINNCSNICFTPNHKIIKEKKKCIDYCTNDNQYIYDLNNICYEIIPEGYYLNNSEFILEQCNIKCKNCSYESNSLCISCNNKDGYYQKSDDYNSFVECYNKEPDNYYLDSVNNIYRPIKEDSTNIIDKSNKEDSTNIIDKSNKEDNTIIIDKSNKEDSKIIIDKSNKEDITNIIEKSNKEDSTNIIDKSNK